MIGWKLATLVVLTFLPAQPLRLPQISIAMRAPRNSERSEVVARSSVDGVLELCRSRDPHSDPVQTLVLELGGESGLIDLKPPRGNIFQLIDIPSNLVVTLLRAMLVDATRFDCHAKCLELTPSDNARAADSAAGGRGRVVFVLRTAGVRLDSAFEIFISTVSVCCQSLPSSMLWGPAGQRLPP